MNFLNQPYHRRIEKSRTEELEFYFPREYGVDALNILSVRNNPDSDDVLFTVGAYPDHTTGYTVFKIRNDYTADLEPGTYWYDVAVRENVSDNGGGMDYRSLVTCSMLDILPASRAVTGKTTYYTSPAPDIIICSDLQYAQLHDYHPEQYAIVVSDLSSSEAASIAAAIRNANGIAGLLTQHDVTVYENNDRSTWDPDRTHTYVSSISIGTEDVYGAFSYGLVMIYKQSQASVVNMLERILSGGTDYMEDYFKKCLKFIDRTT